MSEKKLFNMLDFKVQCAKLSPNKANNKFGLTMGTIYMLTFPCGRKYIGSTIRDMKTRLQDHKNLAKHLDSSLVQIAINHFGINSVEVSEINKIDDKKLLRETEEIYINFFGTRYPNGFNMIRSSEYSDRKKWSDFVLNNSSTQQSDARFVM